MRLYRPVGPKELELIGQSGFTAYPPRLPEQPIFYPVTNFEYAEQIARDWNSTKAEDGNKGFVTTFAIHDDYVSQFERKIVGGKEHEELWVPAEDMDKFNRNIIGKIEIAASYFDGKRI